jgi:hypothetical protein
MLRRPTQIQGQARGALQEHYWSVEVAEQVEIQMEEDPEVDVSLVLEVLSGTTDVLKIC